MKKNYPFDLVTSAIEGYVNGKPTPRTDAFLRDRATKMGDDVLPLIAFARELERELASATEVGTLPREVEELLSDYLRTLRKDVPTLQSTDRIRRIERLFMNNGEGQK